MIITERSLEKYLADWPSCVSLEKGVEWLKAITEIEERIDSLRYEMRKHEKSCQESMEKYMSEVKNAQL